MLFIGHGSPMNAISENAFTRSLNALLVVSAHWLSPGVTAVNVTERPPTIHDFGGFPAELHAMEYPAPGVPWAKGAGLELSGVSRLFSQTLTQRCSRGINLRKPRLTCLCGQAVL